jgi:glycosyltransferase involved in cell wall biosynthesis
LSRKKQILFVKKSSRISGGHIKFHDYFTHALHHPDIDPYVFLAFAKEHGPGEIWRSDLERIVTQPDIEPFDAVFVDGRDWELLPDGVNGTTLIHLIQDFRHADADDPRFAFLSQHAVRICTSPELADAVRPFARGPVEVIPNGIDCRLFTPSVKEKGSVLVWARKDADLGKAIRKSLEAGGTSVRLLTRPVSREEFARLLGRSEVFIGLTKEREGFFLPALEAMASGCAVVCADAIGNRSFCVDGDTCATAQYGDGADHARLARDLLADRERADVLRERGAATARKYTLEREQALFHHIVEEHVLVTSPKAS